MTNEQRPMKLTCYLEAPLLPRLQSAPRFPPFTDAALLHLRLPCDRPLDVLGGDRHSGRGTGLGQRTEAVSGAAAVDGCGFHFHPDPRTGPYFHAAPVWRARADSALFLR